MKKNYLPRAASDRVLWLNNFSNKIGGYAALFGFTAAEVALIAKMATFYAYIIGLIEQVNTFSNNLVSFKNILSIAPNGTSLGPVPTVTIAAAPAVCPAGIFTYISGIVGRIKSNTTAYTDAIGKDLGIVGDEIVFKSTEFKPEISAKAQAGSVVINFTKKDLDGVNVYSHPVGGTDANVWEFLALDNHSPYHDTRPLAVAGQPEKRQYRVRGVYDGVETGLVSDTIEVVFEG